MRHPLHDYSGGGYFITFTTQRRLPLLGRLDTGVFSILPAGEIVLDVWHEIPGRFELVTLDTIQLMPDHAHCILLINSGMDINKEDGKAFLPVVLHWFKGSSAIRIKKLLGWTGKVWGRGYHDRIIRNESELDKFRNYIQTNPFRSTLK